MTWSAEQARRFIAGSRGTHAGLIGHLLLTTGARIGEALALSWANVDLGAGSIRIVATMQLGTTGEIDIAATTKTASSRRTVPLSGSLVDALRDHQAAQAAVFAERGIRNRRNLVFATPAGERVHPSTFRYQAIQLMCGLGLPELTPHQFRHTAGP